MSKIGRKPIKIPEGVEVKVSPNLVTVKGPKGTLSKEIKSDIIKVEVSDGNVRINAVNKTKDKTILTFWGLTWALIRNMIVGVTEGFEKTLEFQGVGYKASVKGNDLELGLGFSHSVTIKAPEGISFKTEKNTIKIMGIDKELVGKVAADIRSKREPEPYKGSGIRYEGEVIKRKAGKKAVASAG